MENFIKDNLVLFAPFILIDLGLTLASLIHVLTHKKFRIGNKALWVVLSFLQIIGPVVYFVYGRGEEE